MVLISMLRFGPSASIVLLLIAALISASALSTHTHDGFHPLVIQACMLPLQLAGLVWAFTTGARERRSP